jgi:hypothetical protein
MLVFDCINYKYSNKMKLVSVIAFMFMVLSLNAQTEGQLTVTTTTVTYGGSYSPYNVVAIWVRSKTGAYIKTLLAYAGTRRAYLSNWATATSSSYNVVDAVTGATQGSHGVRTCKWNGANLTGTVLGDDTYYVVMEMTEGGSNKLASFPIVKGKTQQVVTPANVSGFSNITIKWTPVNTAVDELKFSDLYSVYPNPAQNTIYINGLDVFETQILTLSGKYMFSSFNHQIDISRLSKGTYVAMLVAKTGNFSRVFIKR